ncbi:MAG: hypothetical protein IPH45_20050 [Bacteroidales bacterium]|nr:hypothetical protein [Bacteroidales bacterium]
MRKVLFVFIFLALVFKGFPGPVTDSVKKATFVWSGFIHADAMYDTRQVVEAREGYLLLYPKNILKDKEGKDINQKGSFNQYAMTARLIARMTGPDAFGAKTSAVLEGDFTGASNSENNSFRLRHAYAKLSWPGISVVAGQYWHPLDVPEMIPGVLSLNTGAPFHSFSRQPQIRTDLLFGKLALVFVASSQRDYVNPGPSGSSSIYLRNSGIPNLHAQLQYKGETLFAGVAFDYKILVPRLVTDSNFKANEKLPSLAFLAFLKADFNLINLKMQASYGQNLNDHLMMGGYGVSSRDPITDRRTYSSLNYLNTWMSINTKGKMVQYSVFAGYLKSLGSAEPIIGTLYARDADIDHIYRISPMVTWFSGKMNFAIEAEFTAASYGTPDPKYQITNGKTVNNLRSSLSAVYNF